MDEYRKYEPVFGSWYLNRLIGKGSFGKVFEITREEFGVTYRSALKIITVPQDEDDIKARLTEGSDPETVSEYYEGILREIVNENEIMAQLRGNSNIVSYEDHQIIPHEDGIGYDILIRMELLTPLLDRMIERKLDEKEVVKLGADMCKALEICHGKDIIHRDIKPQNIFISDHGDYKLGDFGIARTIEKTTGGMSRKGTYKYMAPEVFRGEAYDSTADIYSLGLVLYSLLNGNRGPFLPPSPAKVTHNDEEEAKMKRFRGEPVPAPAEAGPMLSHIILKACAYDPRDRYQTAEEMRSDLKSYLNNYNPPPMRTLRRGTSGVCYNEQQESYGEDRTEALVTDSRPAPQVIQPQHVQPRSMPPAAPERRRLLIPVLIAAVIIGIAAGMIGVSMLKPDTAGDTDPSGADPAGTGSMQTGTAQEEAQNSEYKAYADILKQNEAAIRAYDWQNDGSNRCVAVMDISGDGSPELLFFAAAGNTADLHVYTYRDGAAAEYAYDNTGSMDNQGNTPQGVLFRDIPVAAGTKYMIYTGKESGVLYTGSSMGDEHEYYQSDRYYVTDERGIVLDREVANRYAGKTDTAPESDEYYLNGSSISEKQGKAEFKADADALGSLIMYSGNVKDMTVFKKLENNSPVAMTFDQALDMLQKQI